MAPDEGVCMCQVLLHTVIGCFTNQTTSCSLMGPAWLHRTAAAAAAAVADDDDDVSSSRNKTNLLYL